MIGFWSIIQQWTVNILLAVGIFFVAVGVFSLFRFHQFKTRLLGGANIDTVGFLLISGAVLIQHIPSPSVWKIALIMLVAILINPVITQALARGNAESQ